MVTLHSLSNYVLGRTCMHVHVGPRVIRLASALPARASPFSCLSYFIQMEIILADIKLVTMKGHKAQWKIVPEDVKGVEDETLIKINVSTGGLTQAMCDDNDIAPAGENSGASHAALD